MPTDYSSSIGRYWPQDGDGYLINDTSWDLVDESLMPIVQSLIDYLQQNFSGELAAIYLRGSAAWGQFLPGISDLDFFVITHQPNFRWECPSNLQPYLQELIKRYNIDIECKFATKPKSEHSWLIERPYLSAQIKCCSLLLAGEDFAAQIPRIKPGKYLMPHGRWFHEDWMEFKAGNQDNQAIRDMAKLSLRCAYELVMERKGKYTNSLGYCLSGFLEYYPEWSEAGERVLQAFLETASFPANKASINEFWKWQDQQITLSLDSKENS